ncbi:NAD-dependent epimerase/dehydratase family protein [Actinomyces viscosus]|uniref:Short chain dehydrogenase n=1 Tax=Actinomyces viscosus TaxID=1656 RepID=A0A3S4VLG6_ACTVI|nr:NAD-dependent epimerase/dehydratase family protein [Actinomyces viscosus]VEI17929.1 short chain dehydrogenase [Actinomyces viscosus]
MSSSAAKATENPTGSPTNGFDSTIDLSGIPIDTSSPVMVTGATGYLGSWVTKGLLDAGLTVHAAVRDPQAGAKVAHLHRMAEQAPGTLHLFAGDLLQPGSYDEAMKGSAVVIHTASPILHSTNNPQQELIEPALEGTRNVLAGVERTPSVTRVVLTSSIVAMLGDAADLEGYPGRILTETCWNTTSSVDHQPYPYSKTLAEKEAWRLAADQERWDLVTINPAMIVGPALGSTPTSESFNTVRMMIDGTARLGAPLHAWESASSTCVRWPRRISLPPSCPRPTAATSPPPRTPIYWRWPAPCCHASGGCSRCRGAPCLGR